MDKQEVDLADFKVYGFNHTSFTVESLDRAIPFFCDVLGFELLSRAPRGHVLIRRMTALTEADVEIAFVEGPGHRIELVEYKAPADRRESSARLCDFGAAHVAFDVDVVPAAVAAAERHGFRKVGEVIVIDAGPNQGRQVVYLKGPDGFIIEFIGEKPA
jgi:catechol 2,3-dioxygenase-like lactoylglutathione lyase family enzyme